MQKKYIVRRTDAEREVLNRLLTQRRVSSQKVRRARVLLKADVNGPHWPDAQIADAFDCSRKTVENVRERLAPNGFSGVFVNNPPLRFSQRTCRFGSLTGSAPVKASRPIVYRNRAVYRLVLVGLYESMGQYAKAALLFKRSLEIRETKLGKDHPSVATTLNNLAFLYQSMRQLVKAETLFKRSLEIREAKLGKLRLAGSTTVASDWVELPKVRLGIPIKGILLDIVRMDVHDYQAKPGTNAWRPARYMAWVTPKAGEVQIVDLGTAKVIDAAVEKLRQALKESAKLIQSKGEPQAEQALREPLQKLSDLVLKPLLPHIGKAETWLVSPDGNLWLVPWQMLLLADGKYALEKHRISYLNSGRDLIARSPVKVTPTKGLVLADPDFDLDGDGVVGKPEGTRAFSGLLKFGNVRRLPGTATEARAITPALKAYTK